MQITTVVFDYGCVLTWPPSSQGCETIATIAGIPREDLVDRYYGERAAYDRDAISAVEYWRRVVAGYPAAHDVQQLEKLAALDVEVWSQPNQATVGWLPALHDAGLTLAVLSNMPASFCSALEERDRWLDIFDHLIFSGRVKLNKPEPAIYRLLLKTMDVPANQVLFLDDLQSNVQAARDMGINAELYSVFTGGLAAIAARYGLPIPREIPPSESRLKDSICAPHNFQP